MADGRILHRSAGDSAKVSALSDFEYRVWTQYLLSADDHGVMPAEAVKLQADNRSLRNRPKAKVQAAIETVIGVGLLAVFEHQGQRYVCQPDWAERQSIRYPRRSVFPKPPESLHEKAQSLREDSEGSPHPARAGGRETLTPTQTLTPTPAQTERDSVPPVWRKHGPAPHRGLVDTHRPCFVSPACDRGWCVPGWLVTREWLPQVSGDDGQIREFIASVLEMAPAGALGNEPLKFWRAMWLQTHGSRIDRAPQSRTSDTVDAGKEHLRRQIEKFMAEEGGPDETRHRALQG